LDIDTRIFDEVHHTAVDPDNGKDNHSQAVTKLESRRTYGFTATHKEIEGVDVGPVIYRKTEREMIKKSRMLPPQLHEVVAGETEPGDNADCKVMEDTFREYRRLTNTGVKLLVSCRKAVHGTSHIIPLLKHANRMRRTRPHLKVFAVHSSFGCVIGDNGPELRNVSDLEFQYELLNHCQDDRNEAIILHYDILSEGYDIPTLTGTLFYSAACDRRIKQITGRSLRLHTEDRKRLGLDEDHEEVLQAANYDDFIKPFGIVSYAYYGSNGDDTRDRITEVIHDMRTLDEIKRTIIQTTPYNMEELKKVQNVRREKGEPIPLYDLDEYYGNIEHRFEEQQRIQEELNRKEQQIIKSNQLINELFETDVDALFS
jgi:superfamily II DNA or RNA helicase